MAAVLERYTLTADGPEKCGQTCPQFTDAGTLFTPNDASAPGGVTLGRHIVPTGYKHSVKCISVLAFNRDRCQVQDNATVLNLGKVELLIGGSPVWEMRSQDGMPYMSIGGDELVSEYINANQQFNFGDGFVVGSGTAIALRVSPGIIAPIRWTLELYGSSRQLLQGVTTTNSADQTVATFTPGSDYTLKGLAFSSDCPGAVLGQMRIEYNGHALFNFGDMGMEESCTAPVDSDGDCYNVGSGHGSICLPLWNIDLQQGERFNFLAHPWSPVGGFFQAAVFAEEESLGGGGGTTVRKQVIVF
jgi:hypothetical protein